MTTPPKSRSALIAYLRACVEAEDWHGTRDAAADIEIAEAAEGSGRRYNVMVQSGCIVGHGIPGTATRWERDGDMHGPLKRFTLVEARACVARHRPGADAYIVVADDEPPGEPVERPNGKLPSESAREAHFIMFPQTRSVVTHGELALERLDALERILDERLGRS